MARPFNSMLDDRLMKIGGAMTVSIPLSKLVVDPLTLPEFFIFLGNLTMFFGVLILIGGITLHMIEKRYERRVEKGAENIENNVSTESDNDDFPRQIEPSDIDEDDMIAPTRYAL